MNVYHCDQVGITIHHTDTQNLCCEHYVHLEWWLWISSLQHIIVVENLYSLHSVFHSVTKCLGALYYIQHVHIILVVLPFVLWQFTDHTLTSPCPPSLHRGQAHSASPHQLPSQRHTSQYPQAAGHQLCHARAPPPPGQHWSQSDCHQDPAPWRCRPHQPCHPARVAGWKWARSCHLGHPHHSYGWRWTGGTGRADKGGSTTVT